MKSKDINFEYIEDFVDYILDKTEYDEDLFITVISRFNNMRDILRNIMKYEYINFENIHIESPEMTGYKDEYVLSLWVNDGVLEIGCEPLKVDGEYTNPCGDVVYITDECSSKAILSCADSDVYTVSIDKDDNEDTHNDECCECCDCNDDEYCIRYSNEGDMRGFTASKPIKNGYCSYSFYTTDKLSVDDAHSMLKEIGF